MPHVFGRVAKDDAQHRVHGVNVTAARITRRLKLNGLELGKRELGEVARRVYELRFTSDWVERRTPGLRGRRRYPIYQHFFNYGPPCGRWPGEEFEQDRITRLAGLKLADAIEAYLRKPYREVERVTLYSAVEYYNNTRRRALELHNAPEAPKMADVSMTEPMDLLNLARRLRGPLRADTREQRDVVHFRQGSKRKNIPFAFTRSDVQTVTWRFAAEVPGYRYANV